MPTLLDLSPRLSFSFPRKQRSGMNRKVIPINMDSSIVPYPLGKICEIDTYVYERFREVFGRRWPIWCECVVSRGFRGLRLIE